MTATTDRRYCGARKRQGDGTCTRPAGWGTSHPGWGTCKLHLGSTRRHRAAATIAEAEAELATVKAALTEAYRARRHQQPDPDPAAWLTEEHWREIFPDTTQGPGHDGCPPEAKS